MMEERMCKVVCRQPVKVHDLEHGVSEGAVTVLREYPLTVIVDSAPIAQLYCTPDDLEALVIGHCLSRGCIAQASDIQSLTIDRDRHEARVMRRQACAHTAAPATDRAVPLYWQRDWIRALAQRAAADTPLHRTTGATHSSILAVQGEIVFQCEDISRHNTIDKAIGWMLAQGIAPSACALYTTGRMPADMVEKVARAGIPILAGKLVPTLEGIETAQAHGLVLLGRVSRQGFVQYAGVSPVQ